MVQMSIVRPGAQEEMKMPKFRLKTTPIEAEQFFPDQEPWPEGVVRHRDGFWRLDGKLVVPGDWIIADEAGRRRNWPPHLFEWLFEPLLSEDE